jgi:2,4-dienoyl-CoA reductase-like NADH-dependent reductase (Old Yellow Enzyme family)/thioredoxin reductase
MKSLFQQGYIGNMRTKNRFVMSPMETLFGTRKGFVSKKIVEHYVRRAKGGVGLIIIEATYVSLQGRSHPRQLCACDKKFVPKFRQLVSEIHKHNTKVVLQLNHSGRVAESAITGLPILAPSAVPASGKSSVPTAMSLDDINVEIEHFSQAAYLAKKSGFDGVEIHAAHAYLINQFLSAASNKRQDEFGGSLENRARFLRLVITSVKRKVGESYPVWCRLNGEERGIEGAIKSNEAQYFAKIAQEAGSDAIHVTAFGYGPNGLTNFPEIPGGLLPLAKGIKEKVTIPVIAVGSMNPKIGEKALQNEEADFIAMGRSLLCDPEIPNKTLSGRVDDIMPCIHCFFCLDQLVTKRTEIACALNPSIGCESKTVLKPASSYKRVLVIGGGPSGIEAAIIATLRGHKVTILEKGTNLGGQMRLASIPPHKQQISNYLEYILRQIEILRINVLANTEATPDLIKELHPEVIILATGAIPIVPKIKGLEKITTLTAQDVLNGAKVGKYVTIIGGGLVGCETAEFLAEQGSKVTIIEMLPQLADDMMQRLRDGLLQRLKNHGVFWLTNSICEEISQKSIIVKKEDNEVTNILTDSLVLACGAKSNKDLCLSIRYLGKPIYIVGDANKPRGFFEAVHEGFNAGMAI